MTYETLTLDGAPAVRLHGPAGDSVTVLLRGGQVVSWRDASGTERLYCSPLSPLAGPQAVRGGVPVIFPQFNERGPLMRHGFARTRVWALAESPAEAAHPCVVLQLSHAAAETAGWPHDSVCTLTVRLLPQGLEMALRVDNTGSNTLSFQAALHTYLEVGDVTCAVLTGVLPQAAPLALAQPIDTVFEAVPGPLALRSPAGALDLTHEGFADVVVWNPGPEAVLADLPAGGYARFVCVEAAAIAVPVVLAPGDHWQGSQTLRALA
ncbi:MAG: D-hexose-6-phosphate mutarotase [Rhodoferax sp.]|uniref:D-hexose-6-phosphate mutarotase n=1 Tax=Rhodoferax sp. TaxID=50421 RepID=UPI002ACDC3EC|nr:D-hexose-6-phosphate mutarotase [Rhodoferax sp.]MDZ7890741.1 D-hexose-6-phosphate mutarotase [Rhodoferax sp.]